MGRGRAIKSYYQITDRQQAVFSIVGSVRSRITLLRNLLKQYANLFCSEETHLFRWADPFNSTDYNHVCKNAEVLKLHYSMDGVNESELANTQIGHFRKMYGCS